MGTLQIRIEDELKMKAAGLFAELGLDMSTAIRMFLIKSLEVQGLPFDISILDAEKERIRKERDDLIETLHRMQKHSEEVGNSNMTLDEINQIIDEVRKERDKRK